MIENTGIVRKVDELGRIVLPIETRAALGIKERDGLQIFIDSEKGRIILQRASALCLKCGGANHLKEIKAGCYLCDECIKDLKQKLAHRRWGSPNRLPRFSCMSNSIESCQLEKYMTKKRIALLLACCTAICLSACSKGPAPAAYDVDGIVEILFSDIDTVCGDGKLASTGVEMLGRMQDSGDLLLSIVVDSSIEITKEELGPYDHLVVTNPEWLDRFAASSELHEVNLDSLPAGIRDLLTAQMPLWTADGSVLPGGIHLCEYSGGPLLVLPANVGYVDAVQAADPLLVIVDDPASAMSGKGFLLPLSSGTNLAFTNPEKFQVELNESGIQPYVSSIRRIKLQAG